MALRGANFSDSGKINTIKKPLLGAAFYALSIAYHVSGLLEDSGYLAASDDPPEAGAPDFGLACPVIFEKFSISCSGSA
jgi:hypothetical protein